jgi:integrase
VNRRRSKSRAGFPRNLYESKGYYSWRNPLTGETFGIGTSRSQAFDEALEANLKIAKQLARPRLVDRISGDRTRSVIAWEEKYQGIVEKRGLTKETRSNYLAFSRRVVKMLGEKPMRAVTALSVSEGLEAIAEIEGMPRTANAVRAYMRQSFETAVSAGWIDANPVRANIIMGDKSAKRARLSLEVFLRVYETASTEWLRNAMALALVSAQRREDVARAEFKDFKDGGWWLTQASEKTDHAHRIFIPLELKPRGFDYSLGDVVSNARRSGVLSSYVVHQTVRRGKSDRGRKIRLSTVSRAFTEAVDALGIDWSTNTPPTFHEIRSLSLRLYGDQGVNVQLLAGHSDPDTTAIYLNSRGQDYARVTV